MSKKRDRAELEARRLEGARLLRRGARPAEVAGALKPFLRRMRTASRPSMSGKPTSMMTRSICPALAACTPLLPFSAATASYSSYSASARRAVRDHRR